jgi:hypothetical protein
MYKLFYTVVAYFSQNSVTQKLFTTVVTLFS